MLRRAGPITPNVEAAEVALAEGAVLGRVETDVGASGAIEVHALDIAELGPFNVGAAQVGALEQERLELGVTQLRFAQVGIAQIDLRSTGMQQARQIVPPLFILDRGHPSEELIGVGRHELNEVGDAEDVHGRVFLLNFGDIAGRIAAAAVARDQVIRTRRSFHHTSATRSAQRCHSG